MKHTRAFEEFEFREDHIPRERVSKEEFVDEFLDRLYMNGSKEDGKYILTLPEATQAAIEIYNDFVK
jgi:hypothetical protein